jgi:hypothetical protein
MVVLTTTFSLEVGKDADHGARSALSSLTWIRVGSTNRIALLSGYPLI